MKELVCSSKNLGSTKVITKDNYVCQEAFVRNSHDAKKSYFTKKSLKDR